MVDMRDMYVVVGGRYIFWIRSKGMEEKSKMETRCRRRNVEIDMARYMLRT